MVHLMLFAAPCMQPKCIYPCHICTLKQPPSLPILLYANHPYFSFLLKHDITHTHTNTHTHTHTGILRVLRTIQCM